MGWLVRAFESDIQKHVGGILGIFKKENEIYSLVKLPPSIQSMQANSVREIIRHDIRTYRHLKYPTQNETILHKPEWHNWQVSFMMRAVKDKLGIVMYNKEELFIPELLAMKSDEIKLMAEQLLVQYSEKVDILQSKETLRQEYVWSAYQVGVLLLHLSNLGDEK